MKAPVALLAVAVLLAAPLAAQSDVWLSIADLYRLDLSTGEATQVNTDRCYVYDMQRSSDGSSIYVADARGLHVRSTTNDSAPRVIRSGQPFFNIDVVDGVIYSITQANTAKPESRLVEIFKPDGKVMNQFKVGKYASRITVTPDGAKIIVADLRNN
ncbi:MAG: hypothetical protein QGF59_14175, partial [Pirellulaceae bacterium]|nr:hypothetical protein [Pirellulaceae bacterium]